jgi:hypothetical protein
MGSVLKPERRSIRRDTMTEAQSPTPPTRRTPSWAQLRIWHLALLVLFAAIAIADVQDQRIREPALIALAAGGLVLYGLIGWIGWWAVRRFEPRLGPILLFILYSVAMGVLFLVATVIYLVIAHVYRGGRL